jgi:hypothetical protein
MIINFNKKCGPKQRGEKVGGGDVWVEIEMFLKFWF